MIVELSFANNILKYLRNIFIFYLEIKIKKIVLAPLETNLCIQIPFKNPNEINLKTFGIYKVKELKTLINYYFKASTKTDRKNIKYNFLAYLNRVCKLKIQIFKQNALNTIKLSNGTYLSSNCILATYHGCSNLIEDTNSDVKLVN